MTGARRQGRHRGEVDPSVPLRRDPDRLWGPEPLLLFALAVLPLAAAVGLGATASAWWHVLPAAALLALGVLGFVVLVRWLAQASADWHAERARRRHGAPQVSDARRRPAGSGSDGPRA